MVYARTILLPLVFVVAAGCAGPNQISRGLDFKLNQLYVDNPALAEVVHPFGFVGMNLAWTADACFVNPWYFWREAPAGAGSAYYYKQPVTPETRFPPSTNGGKGDKGNGKKSSQGSSKAKNPASGESNNKGYITHRVKQGDTFSSIAQKYYNDRKRWKDIYRANQNVVPSENRIYPGRVLLIPTD